MICKIENLSKLRQLETLNLSYNKLRRAEGLKGLISLNNLDISYNSLSSKADIEKLKYSPTVSTVIYPHY